MLTRKIYVDTVDKVKKLVGEATAVSFEVNILTDKFTVNAKSILGIFSLDRSAPVVMSIDADENDPEVAGFLNRVSEYLVD